MFGVLQISATSADRTMTQPLGYDKDICLTLFDYLHIYTFRQPLRELRKSHKTSFLSFTQNQLFLGLVDKN